jgi:hypothetical protein
MAVAGSAGGVAGAVLGAMVVGGFNLGSLAEWASGVGTVGALFVTYRLLQHDIATRRADEARRRDDASKAAARRVLDALLDSAPVYETGASLADMKDAAVKLASAIERDDPFIVGAPGVRERVMICRHALRHAGFASPFSHDDLPDEYRQALALMLAAHLVDATKTELVRYLTDASLGAWDDRTLFPAGLLDTRPWMIERVNEMAADDAEARE